MLTYFLAVNEVFHVYLHMQVLDMRSSYTQEDLTTRQLYFVFDALTPWLSVLACGDNMTSYVLALVSVHTLIHSYYIINWHNQNNILVQSIRKWTTTTSKQERQDSRFYMFNIIGTLFDIFVHTLIAFYLVTSR